MTSQKIRAQRVARLSRRHFEDALIFTARADDKAFRGAVARRRSPRNQAISWKWNIRRVGQKAEHRECYGERVVYTTMISSAPGEVFKIAARLAAHTLAETVIERIHEVLPSLKWRGN